MKQIKSSSWLIPVRREVLLKVCFSDDLTFREAQKAFFNGDYEDVIDEQLMYEEILEGLEPA